MLIRWATSYFKNKYKPTYIKFFDTSANYLNKFIIDNNLVKFIKSDYLSWNIEVDIFGIMIKNNKSKIILIEAKNKKLSLMNLSQLIGYSKVVEPDFSFLISDKSASNNLHDVFKKYTRNDLLNLKNRNTSSKISILKFDLQKKDVDWFNSYTNEN